MPVLKNSILELFKDENKRKQMSKVGYVNSTKYFKEKYYEEFVNLLLIDKKVSSYE